MPSPECVGRVWRGIPAIFLSDRRSAMKYGDHRDGLVSPTQSCCGSMIFTEPTAPFPVSSSRQGEADTFILGPAQLKTGHIVSRELSWVIAAASEVPSTLTL